MDNILAGAYYVPITHPELGRIRKDLTFRIPGLDKDEPPTVVHAWTTDRDGYIGVPRQYGLNLSLAEYEVQLSKGKAIRSRLTPVMLYDYQEPWVHKVTDLVKAGRDLVAKAATGKGKTVMSLEIARRLGRTTLVVVDQNFLRDQWEGQAKFFLNMPDHKIGFVQGNKCEYEGKDLVIAMIQTLYSRKFTADFYSYFGTVIFDESHTVGAPVFSKVLLQFPAQYRFGVSATPERRDALNKVIEYNLGRVLVRLEKEHKKSIVRYIEHDGVYSWYANISPKMGRYINEIAADPARNLLLAQAIKWLYDSDRDVLAISDRIEHVESLLCLCKYMGIPESDMGLVTGYSNTWSYAKDPLPKRKPEHLEKGAAYTPIKLQLIAKRNPVKKLKEIKETKRVLFATYGMFSKGVDVPRLSAGIDCTPRSQFQQVHGRILRDDEDKQVPIWVTIRDVNSFRSEYQFGQRIREFTKSNAEIYKWVPGKGIKKQDPSQLIAQAQSRADSLKASEITTKSDGSYTVQTRSTGIRSRSKSGSSTARPTLRRRQN